MTGITESSAKEVHPIAQGSLSNGAFDGFVLLTRVFWDSSQVLEWPAPLMRNSSPVEVPSINSVAMGQGLSYLVALSDKNMVVVWKREDSS